MMDGKKLPELILGQLLHFSAADCSEWQQLGPGASGTVQSYSSDAGLGYRDPQ